MQDKENKRIAIYLVVGAILEIVGQTLFTLSDEQGKKYCGIAMLVGLLFVIKSSKWYAMSKGYKQAYGYLALLNGIGLLALLLLPQRDRTTIEATGAQRKSLCTDSGMRAKVFRAPSVSFLMKRSTWILIILVSCIILQIAAIVLHNVGGKTEILWSRALKTVIVLLIIITCQLYAVEKGYKPAYGWLGILHIIGLIIIACLPNRHHKTTPGSPRC